MNKKERWVFIVNPIAGNGRAINVAETLKLKIKDFKIDAQVEYTTAKGDAVTLTNNYANKGYNHIIGVGGDGTFNEIASALLNRKNIITGMIPAGTGNDFIQILGFGNSFSDNDWELFFKRDTILMDLGNCNNMVFANGMGLGFDAQVAAENYVEPDKVKRGTKNKYIWHILKTLLFYREKTMISIDGRNKNRSDCFINTVSIGRRFAGGFLLTPKAIANDGLLDICAITRLNLFQRLHILLKVPKGTHINDRKVNYYSTEKLKLEFTEELPYHIDGEIYFSKKFKIEVIPEALRIIYNKKGPHFFNTENL